MVCPNCHSDHIVQVQDQYFCINCGQAVPDSAVKKAAKVDGKIALQANGLPEGVKVIPVSGKPKDEPKLPEIKKAAAKNKADVKADVKAEVKVKVAAKAEPPPEPATDNAAAAPVEAKAGLVNIVTPRKRMGGDEVADAATAKRKPGRPKSGRLDAPVQMATLTDAPADAPAPAPEKAPPAAKAPDPPPAPPPAEDSGPKPIITLPNNPKPEAPVAAAATAADASKPTPVLPAAPKITPAPGRKKAHSRRMNDLAPRKKDEPHEEEAPEHEEKAEPEAAREAEAGTLKVHAHEAPIAKGRHHVHKVEVPPLHFGALTKASLRSRFHRGYFALSAAAALFLAIAAGYGAWLYFNNGFSHLADVITQGATLSLAEAAVLALLYYIGRSISQAAVTYGIMREADGRPVGLARQINVGINTFPRRLALDVTCATLGLGLIAAVSALVFAGGSSWPVGIQFQVAGLFGAFLLLLYLFAALAISRSLAGIAITVTDEEPLDAAKLGWHLFSHRFELIGWRFLGLAVEVIMLLPILAATVALLSAVPGPFHEVAVLGVGLLAWFAGALLGAGTAAWWTHIYRQLVLADHPDDSSKLLSGRQSASAKAGDLTLVVALTSFLLATALALPWLRLE